MKAEAAAFIIKEGIIISTRIGTGNAWHQNIVYKNEAGMITLPLLDMYLENYSVIGTPVTLKHTNEYYEYLFDGTILDIKLDYPRRITIKITKAEEKVNGRWFPRYDTSLPSYISPVWDDNSIFAVVSNLSLVGMAFVTRHSFDVNEDCTAFIHLPEEVVSRVRGKIVRKTVKSTHTEYGLSFVDMTEHDSNLLSAYINSLEDNRASLQWNFTNNIKGRL